MENNSGWNYIISLSDASAAIGYHSDYLGYLARTGKLEAKKIGRNWVTTKLAIERFKQVRERPKANSSSSQKVNVRVLNSQSRPSSASDQSALAQEDFLHFSYQESENELACEHQINNVPSIARNEMEQIAAEIAVRKIREHFDRQTNFSMVKEIAKKTKMEKEQTQLKRELQEKLESFQKYFKIELEQIIARHIIALKSAEPPVQFVAVPSLVRPNDMMARNQDYAVYHSVSFLPQAQALENGEVFHGMDNSLNTQTLNVEKIYHSFQNSFSFSKRVGILLIITITVLIYLQLFLQLLQIQARFI